MARRKIKLAEVGRLAVLPALVVSDAVTMTAGIARNLAGRIVGRRIKSIKGVKPVQ